MKRKELIDTLARVHPALATNESLSEIFTHYCFDGKYLTAYDGARLGITMPFESDFKAGIPGRTLDDLLSSVYTEEVQLTITDGEGKGNLEIKAGKATMVLATIAPDLLTIFQKEFLEGETQVVGVSGAALLGAVRCCLNSLGDDSRVETSGLYFRRDRDFLVVYGFNHISISIAEVKLTGGDKNKLKLDDDGILVPGSFCKLMVDYLQKPQDDDPSSFEIGDRFALITSGKLNAFGPLLTQQTKLDFEKALEDNFPASDEKNLVAIPSGIKEVLERACIIINTKVDGAQRTDITVKDGKARFFSQSPRGQVVDMVDIPGHPDVRVGVDPKPLLDALPFFNTDENPGKMLLAKKCAVFKRSSQTYMVAAFQSKTE